jgi:glycosyltransferase involved in cell wall biosynthesis
MVIGRHVLFIVENNTVPFDRRVWAEARAARSFGYDVSVICPFDRNRSDVRDFVDGIRIYRHPRPVEGSKTWATLLEYVNAFFWESLYSLRIYLARPFAVIHAANPPDHVFLIALAYRLAGVKFIFDHHDLTPETYVAKYGTKGLIHRILLWMERRSFQSADLVISTNESYKKIATGRGGKSEEDVAVVRNGPDLQAIPEVGPDPGLREGFRHLVGYVGIIGQQEGIENLLEAASHIVRVKNRRDIKFAVVGTGPHLKNVIQQANAMALGRYFQFFGYVPDDRLYKILATSDICVNPEFRNEFTERSTMIKVMEYMCFGKAIVQFRTIESEYSAGDAAIHVPDNDVFQFAEAILALLDDPARRERMGRIGRERVERLLSWQIQKKNLERAYGRIMAERRRP